jgi:hypothetical protein
MRPFLWLSLIPRFGPSAEGRCVPPLNQTPIAQVSCKDSLWVGIPTSMTDQRYPGGTCTSATPSISRNLAKVGGY